MVAHGPPCAFESRWATLLLGEAPNRWMGSDMKARAHHVLFRQDLADLCGINKVEFYRCFARANLLDYYPGRSGKGSSFPREEAAERARELDEALGETGELRRIVLLGKRVGRAYLGGGCSWYEWTTAGKGPPVAVVPHPSRVSRYWNDPANVSRATRFWTDLASGILEQVNAERRRRRG